ncbi:hypothetical protein BC831DRAFT_424541, partial [Entophlyctis helioformis]
MPRLRRLRLHTHRPPPPPPSHLRRMHLRSARLHQLLRQPTLCWAGFARHLPPPPPAHRPRLPRSSSRPPRPRRRPHRHRASASASTSAHASDAAPVLRSSFYPSPDLTDLETAATADHHPHYHPHPHYQHHQHQQYQMRAPHSATHMGGHQHHPYHVPQQRTQRSHSTVSATSGVCIAALSVHLHTATALPRPVCLSALSSGCLSCRVAVCQIDRPIWCSARSGARSAAQRRSCIDWTRPEPARPGNVWSAPAVVMPCVVIALLLPLPRPKPATMSLPSTAPLPARPQLAR